MTLRQFPSDLAVLGIGVDQRVQQRAPVLVSSQSLALGTDSLGDIAKAVIGPAKVEPRAGVISTLVEKILVVFERCLEQDVTGSLHPGLLQHWILSHNGEALID